MIITQSIGNKTKAINSIMEKIKYALYPTLLDSFYWYKRGFNEKEEIINKINRVKTDMPEAAKKGVAFEACVNNLIKTGTVNHPLMQGEFFEKDGFHFKGPVVLRIAKKLQNAKKLQEYIQANVQTPAGLIKVYGFIDFSYDDMYVDLKTTASYKRDKYAINNQHKCYPLLNQLNGGKVDKFNYLVTDFNDMYIEPYVFTKSLQDEFIFNLVEFTEFLEANRDIITDTKIFAK